jgi:hypothetical protein
LDLLIANRGLVAVVLQLFMHVDCKGAGEGEE